MTSENTITELLKRFHPPAQDRNTMSFCQDNRPSSVAAWAESLPATRISNTSVMLYKALPEVVRLDVSFDNKLKMLESLRPYVQRCIQGLAKNFLNQPLILPEGAMKTAVIAQALQKHMTSGYVLVLMGMLKAHAEKPLSPQQMTDLTMTIHRAITGYGLQFFRSAQLYTPAPSNLWSELNGLFLIAESLELLNAAVEDTLLKDHKSISIEHAFHRTLMVACASPNQMRQNDLLALYDALESWCIKFHLNELEGTSENLFIIDLNSNQGPHYLSGAKTEKNDNIRALDFSLILFALEKFESGHIEDGFVPLKIATSKVVYRHIKEFWGEERSRGSERLATHTRLDVVVGLTSIHYYSAGEESFNSFMLEREDSPGSFASHFQGMDTESSKDPWADVPDAAGGTHIVNLQFEDMLEDSETKVENKYPIFPTVTLDASAEGYCLDWRDEIPANAKVGELLGVREVGRSSWSIGVIRWVRQSKSSSQLGIQMISPIVKPIAAQQIQRSGENGSFMRALFIPEIKTSKTPATIMTPVLPFKVTDKVNLNDHGKTSTIQLVKQLFSSSAVNRFTYRVLDSGLQQDPNEGEAPESW